MHFCWFSFTNICTSLGSSVGKESASSAGDPGSVPGSGRCSPRRRKWQTTPVFLPAKSQGQWTLVEWIPSDHKELSHVSLWIHPILYSQFSSHGLLSCFCRGLNSVSSKSTSTWNLKMCSHLQIGFYQCNWLRIPRGNFPGF